MILLVVTRECVLGEFLEFFQKTHKNPDFLNCQKIIGMSLNCIHTNDNTTWTSPLLLKHAPIIWWSWSFQTSLFNSKICSTKKVTVIAVFWDGKTCYLLINIIPRGETLNVATSCQILYFITQFKTSNVHCCIVLSWFFYCIADGVGSTV